MRKILWIGLGIGIISVAFYFFKGFDKTPEEQPEVPYPSPESSEEFFEPFPSEEKMEFSKQESTTQRELPKRKPLKPGLEALLPPPVQGRILLPKMDVSKAREVKEPVLLLKHAHFKLDPKYLPKLQGSGLGVVYLQFKSADLTGAHKSELERLGVTLLDYLPVQTWLASIKNVKKLSMLKKHPNVYAIGEIDTRDKLQVELLSHDFHDYAKDAEGLGIVKVYLVQKGGRASLLQFIKSEFGRVSDLSSLDKLEVTAPKETIAKLLMRPEVKWVEEIPPPVIPNNQSAVFLSRLNQLADLGLQGEGVHLGIWEEGPPATHTELGNRVTIVEKKVPQEHATHVAGTLIGDGSVNPRARGVASKALLYAYDYFGNIPSEVQEAIRSYKIEASNHSHGITVGWHLGFLGSWTFESDQTLFGQYTANAAEYDRLVFETDHILVKSAGNDRDDVGVGPQPPDGGELGFDTIPGDGSVSKNVITVGSVADVRSISPFSSWGPTDDGRIKPDWVAKGEAVFSLLPKSKQGKDQYGLLSGTSMATPVVTGAVALLIERYKQLFSQKPSAALIKALCVQGARDLDHPGPDYKTGWGLLDGEASIALLEKDAHFWIRVPLQASLEKEFSFRVEAHLDTLKITSVWLDPPAHPSAFLTLVYDFDTELVAPDGKSYFPWVLDGTHPQVSAKRGRNKTDPIEQIVVENPLVGIWTLKVKAPPNLLEKHNVYVASNVSLF